MLSVVKHAVSKEKRRLEIDGFDLDFSYINERIIAMGFPAESTEALYRNSMTEVQRYFQEKHQNHYKVYNLCSERQYDPSKFFKVARYPFDDHNCPPLTMVYDFCVDVKQWLDMDSSNVAAIHCKAGKGRTGLMICAYLLFAREWNTASESMRFYAAARTKNQKGLTIPSQKRYVEHFEELLHRFSWQVPPSPPPAYKLEKLVLYSFNEPLQMKIMDVKGEPIPLPMKEEKAHKITRSNSNSVLLDSSEKQMTISCYNLHLCGDYKIAFLGKNKKFWFWFNTYFVKDNRLCLAKEQIDKAHKDKKHKIYSPTFSIEAFFQPADNNNLLSSSSTSSPSNSNQIDPNAYEYKEKDEGWIRVSGAPTAAVALAKNNSSSSLRMSTPRLKLIYGNTGSPREARSVILDRGALNLPSAPPPEPPSHDSEEEVLPPLPALPPPSLPLSGSNSTPSSPMTPKAPPPRPPRSSVNSQVLHLSADDHQSPR